MRRRRCLREANRAIEGSIMYFPLVPNPAAEKFQALWRANKAAGMDFAGQGKGGEWVDEALLKTAADIKEEAIYLVKRVEAGQSANAVRELAEPLSDLIFRLATLYGIKISG